MTVVRTLADLKAHGMGLVGNCGNPDCLHERLLPLDSLIETYGTHYSHINERRIGRALRCRRCGHLGGTITVAAKTPPPPGTPSR